MWEFWIVGNSLQSFDDIIQNCFYGKTEKSRFERFLTRHLCRVNFHEKVRCEYSVYEENYSFTTIYKGRLSRFWFIFKCINHDSTAKIENSPGRIYKISEEMEADPRNAICYEDMSDDDETGCAPTSSRASLSSDLSDDTFETYQMSVPIRVVTPTGYVIWASVPKC